MITFARNNILDADVEALVNPVNCVRVMGKGLALQFKMAYPDAFRESRRSPAFCAIVTTWALRTRTTSTSAT